MKWRVVVGLTGADGTVRTHQVSAGGATAIELSSATIGRTLTDGERALAALQGHLVRAQAEDYDRGRRRYPRWPGEPASVRPRRHVLNWFHLACASSMPRKRPRAGALVSARGSSPAQGPNRGDEQDARSRSRRCRTMRQAAIPAGVIEPPGLRRSPASWLNDVEKFFSTLTRRRIRRGSCHSIVACKRPSTATSPNRTPSQSPSSGRRRPLPSWPSSTDCPHPPNRSDP